MKIREEKKPFDYERFIRETEEALLCKHDRQVIGRKTKSNGQPYFRLQCPDCGCPLSDQLKFSKVDELRASGIPEQLWNQELAEEYQREFWRIANPIHGRINAERDNFWKNYNFYLETNKWKALRHRVLERECYVCEICGTNRATEVHHLTYDRVGNENLEDLQAVCELCHDRIHIERQKESND